MDLAALVDRFLPTAGSRLDDVSEAAHAKVSDLTASGPAAAATYVLRGNEWLGHPIHPLMIGIPVGAFTMTAVYDAKAALSGGDEVAERAAQTATLWGLAGSVLAAVTGVVQFLDTRGAARRETTVHAALNYAATGLYAGSYVARRSGRHPLGRKLGAAGYSTLMASGYLGGDLAFRHGVGMRPQVIRDIAKPVALSSDEPVKTASAVHR